jgi:hypothetical protein
MQNIINSFIVLLLLISFACRESDEVMSISIKNETPYLVELTLNEIVDNGYINEKSLISGQSVSIHGSSDHLVSPNDVLNRSYNQFTAKLSTEDDTVELVFNARSSENYALNPYTDSMAWTLTIEEDIMDRPVTIWNYEFIIREELIEP